MTFCEMKKFSFEIGKWHNKRSELEMKTKQVEASQPNEANKSSVISSVKKNESRKKFMKKKTINDSVQKEMLVPISVRNFISEI